MPKLSKTDRTLLALFSIGTLLLILGSLLHFYAKPSGVWCAAMGDLLILIYYFSSIPKLEGSELSISKAERVRIRRLHRIGFIGAIIIGVSLYFMFTNSTSWMVFFFIGSILHLWYIFRS